MSAARRMSTVRRIWRYCGRPLTGPQRRRCDVKLCGQFGGPPYFRLSLQRPWQTQPKGRPTPRRRDAVAARLASRAGGAS